MCELREKGTSTAVEMGQHKSHEQYFYLKQ